MSGSAPGPGHDAAARGNARLATVMLTVTCLCWGSTFLLMKLGAERIRAIGGLRDGLVASALFLLVRFALAAVLTPLCIPRAWRRLDGAAWRHGFLLSLPFSAGFILQVFGLAQDDVTPSQSAFLTSLFVVATPILDGVIRRRRPTLGVLAGVALATLGAAFIQGPPRGGLSLGAWATIACAVVFAGHILLTDHSTRRADPMALTFTTLVLSTLWMLLALLALPGGAAVLRPALVGRLLLDPVFAGAMAVCTLLATVVALALLNRWQKELSPSRAAIVYTSEPVFATLVSIAAGRERLAFWLFFGAAMILAANLAVEFIGRRRVPPPDSRA
ncbi:MAG: DMT family transporter [Deltaproteobacteria bacterium]|nr:DMT family transporter [Deltaproteobacteria bacterium]